MQNFDLLITQISARVRLIYKKEKNNNTISGGCI